jgi:hypothetical protein
MYLLGAAREDLGKAIHEKYLKDDVKEWDREAMRGLSDFLTKAKFEIYRLE